jgi:hypothetical protein
MKGPLRRVAFAQACRAAKYRVRSKRGVFKAGIVIAASLLAIGGLFYLAARTIPRL